jgi:hypothetical protein
LRACAYYGEFEKPKIIFPDIATEARFVLDRNNQYCDTTVFLIPIDDLIMLALLNSSPLLELYKILSPQVQGGFLRYKRQYVSQLPIPNATKKDKTALERLAQKCLAKRGIDCQAEEDEINAVAARLYGL